MSCAGHPCVQTPHLDLLADQGIVFDRAYVNCPVCIPARTSLVTGIHAHNYGSPGYNEGFRIDRDREQFLGSLLTKAGYQTHLIGKKHWHTPNKFRAGFETHISAQDRYREMDRAGVYVPSHGVGANDWSPTVTNTPEQFMDTHWTITKAVEFLQDRDPDQPFCLWASMIDPHPPNAVHEPFFSMYDTHDIPEPVLPEWAEGENLPHSLQILRACQGHRHLTPAMMRKVRSVYYGQITNMDYQLGRLFAALRETGEWDNTLIVYTSDHGDSLGDHGTFFKSNFTDGGARVPMVVRPPKSLGTSQWGSHSKQLVEWADLLPTFCELAGAEAPEDIDGKSMVPLFKDDSAIHEFLHGHIDHQHMYHDGRYKYLYFTTDGRELVFDKDNDPLDEYDLSGDEALVTRLRQAFVDHLKGESHSHLKADGILENQDRTLQPEETWGGMNWAGLKALLNRNYN